MLLMIKSVLIISLTKSIIITAFDCIFYHDYNAVSKVDQVVAVHIDDVKIRTSHRLQSLHIFTTDPLYIYSSYLYMYIQTYSCNIAVNIAVLQLKDDVRGIISMYLYWY